MTCIEDSLSEKTTQIGRLAHPRDFPDTIAGCDHERLRVMEVKALDARRPRGKKLWTNATHLIDQSRIFAPARAVRQIADTSSSEQFSNMGDGHNDDRNDDRDREGEPRTDTSTETLHAGCSLCVARPPYLAAFLPDWQARLAASGFPFQQWRDVLGSRSKPSPMLLDCSIDKGSANCNAALPELMHTAFDSVVGVQVAIVGRGTIGPGEQVFANYITDGPLNTDKFFSHRACCAANSPIGYVCVFGICKLITMMTEVDLLWYATQPRWTTSGVWSSRHRSVCLLELLHVPNVHELTDCTCFVW